MAAERFVKLKVSVQTVIDAPIEDVFARMVDLENWPQYISDVTEVEVFTPGPVGVGTRFRETRIMFGREASEDMTFSEFDPPRRFLLTAENHGTRYRADHVLSQSADGTKVQVDFGGEPVSLTAKIFSVLAWFMASSVKKALEKDLIDLKVACEGGRTTT